MEKKATIIAVCGKGGVGKTSMSALIIRTLLEKKKDARILAIDADPAVGFATALGVDIGRTVDDIRLEVIKSGKEDDKSALYDIISRLDYEVMDAIIEKEKFAFLAIGRPETEGCYCKVNNYLKEIIGSLAKDFDYVVIDGEAGIEQINRRVMEKVTHLLLVSDCSKKGINVIKTIKDVSKNVMEYDHVGCILNRLASEEESQMVDLGDIPLLGAITEDKKLRQYDIEGTSLLKLPDGKTTDALEKALQCFEIL